MIGNSSVISIQIKKALSLKTYNLNDETKTNLIAHNDNDNTNPGAKIQQKYDTAKSDVNKLSEFKTSIEQR